MRWYAQAIVYGSDGACKLWCTHLMVHANYGARKLWCTQVMVHASDRNLFLYIMVHVLLGWTK